MVHGQQDRLTVGIITSITVDLEYGNNGEEAFSPFISFFLPSSLQYVNKEPQEVWHFKLASFPGLLCYARQNRL